MLFRVFARNELEHLFAVLSYNRIIGATRRAISREGEPLYVYEQLYDFADLAFDHATTAHSPKEHFLPHRQTMATYAVDGSRWQRRNAATAVPPTVFFGLHACDINALNRLDRVLLDPAHVNPWYEARRRSTFIIGIGCTPQPYCFCASMGCADVLHGCDMFLTDIGDRYFCEIRSSAAYEVLREVESEEAGAADEARYVEVCAERRQKFSCRVDTSELTRILDLEFEAEAWQEWGSRCLSCGTCANVCPTCYCYGTEHLVDVDLAGARKEMLLYSCNLIDFAEVAGGRNFRPDSATRLKYRYYHKHRGFVEAYEESLCVGCGRCGKACLAGIRPTEVIASIRREAQRGG